MLLNSEAHSVNTKPMDRKKQTTQRCVNCGQVSFVQLFEAYDFDTGNKHFALEKCGNCELARTSPVLNGAELAPFYDTDYYGSSNKKFNSIIEAWTVSSNNRLAHKILQSAGKRINHAGQKIRVLDIGCGRANLLKAFDRNGCECFGIERSNFPEDPALQNITVYKQDFLEVNLEENSFDIVVIWHVLEHLTDPASTLKKVGKILRQGGKLVVAVPNFGGLQSRLFRRHWFHLDLPRHTYHFTHHSLQLMINSAGMSVANLTTGSLDQGAYGFLQSTLNLLLPGQPNKLYSILKKSQQKHSIISIVPQFMLAALLTPFALLEYFLSTAIDAGPCLIVEATKNDTVK